MRVAIYARISTSDRGQTLETQLLPLRRFVADQGWTVTGEFCDEAPATDTRARGAWRQVLSLASRRQIDLVLVFRIDRAFRSVLDAATTLERLRGWRVGLRSYSEPWLDTTSPFGEALYYITAAYAQLERGILSERVRAGLDRARRQGRKLGRPGGTGRDGFREEWAALRPDVLEGRISKHQAARALGVSKSTVLRLLRGDRGAQSAQIPGADAAPGHGADAGVQNPVGKALAGAA